MLVLQQAACMPWSSTRSAGILFTKQSGEPTMAGPTAGCGHAGQPCAQAGMFDLSPSRLWGGIRAPAILYASEGGELPRGSSQFPGANVVAAIGYGAAGV